MEEGPDSKLANDGECLMDHKACKERRCADRQRNAERSWSDEVCAIAHELGIEYTPDGNACQPGPLRDLLTEIRRLKGACVDKARDTGVSCPDGTDPDEPSDRGFVCTHEVARDHARNELAQLINRCEERNTTHACSGDWETCWCDTCEARRKAGGSEHFDILAEVKIRRSETASHSEGKGNGE